MRAAVKVVVCYPSATEFEEIDEFSYDSPKVFFGTNQTTKLVQICKKYKETKSEFKELFNFASLGRESYRSNILVHTMVGMIKQNITFETKVLIIERL